MGGFGSGERWRKKRTVEGCWSLDTTTFRRWGWLGSPGSRAGTLGWGAATGGRYEAEVRYELEIGENAGSVRLRYEPTRIPGEPLDYRVPLVATPCRLGGRRWWFVCPLTRDGQGCGRRARKLFLVGRYFGCRACHDLTYRSRQRSDARAYALARRGVDAIRPTRGQKVGDLGVMMHALTILQKRYARPLRFR